MSLRDEGPLPDEALRNLAQLNTLYVERDHYVEEAQRLARVVAYLVRENGGQLEVPIGEFDKLGDTDRQMLSFEPDTEHDVVLVVLEDAPPERT